MKAPRLTAREARIKAHKDAEALILAGNPEKASKVLRNRGVSPIPASMIGPSTGGRPRTGNHAVRTQTDMRGKPTGELGSSHAHLDLAYNRFLDGIREEDLQQALATAPGLQELKKSKYQQALLMLTHPGYQRATRRGPDSKVAGGGLKHGEWSIAAILKHAGITLGELMEVYGRYRTAQAIRIAMDRSPTIITHAADDAENRMVNCPRCDGLGTLDLDEVAEEVSKKRRAAVVRTCPECKGTGEVVQSGDAEARKLVLEVAGIAGKKGPVVDARSVHYGHGVFSVESLVKGMEQLEAPQTDDTIDAEVIDDAKVSGSSPEEGISE